MPAIQTLFYFAALRPYMFLGSTLVSIEPCCPFRRVAATQHLPNKKARHVDLAFLFWGISYLLVPTLGQGIDKAQL